jgi:hypothetical protein
VNDSAANALAFDLLMLNGEDLRRKPYRERKSALRRLLRHDHGIPSCRIAAADIFPPNVWPPFQEGGQHFASCSAIFWSAFETFNENKRPATDRRRYEPGAPILSHSIARQFA